MAELKNVRLQAGLGTEVARKYKSQSNINTISLGRVTRINYRFNTVDFLLVSGGGTALLNAANDDGSYSAKLPVTFGGRNGYGKAYGTIHPVHINDIVLVGFIDGKKSNAIVLNSYVDNAVGLELSKTNNDQIDPADPSQVIDADQTYVVYPDLTYERHDGRGNLELSFNGKSFMVVDSDDYSGGTTLSDDGDALMDYKHLKGSYYHNNEMLEPVNGRAPRILMKHQGIDLPDGSVDNHAFYLNLSPDGTFRISQMQTNEDWRTYFEQTADGKIHMRRQNDSKVFGAGDITADMGIDENGYVFLRSGDTELQLRPDGIYTAGNNNLTGGIDPDFESNVNKAIGNMITKDTFNTVMAQNIKAVQDLIDTTTAEQASVDKSLISILNDSVVSPSEKTLLKQFLDKIDTDYTANTALALANNVDTASYDADYTALHKILEPILEHMDEDSKVDKNVVKTDFDVYYHDCLTLLSDVLKAIQDKSKDSFTDALSAGNAIENANKLLQDALDALSSIDFGNLTAADSSKIKQLWENAKSNHDSTKSLLGQTTLDTTAFDTAYHVLDGLLDGVDFTKPLTIDLTGLKQDFTDYYNAAAALLKLFGGNALETIKNLQGDMEHLQSSIKQNEKNINFNVNAIEKQGNTLTVQAADINVLKDSITSTVSKTTIQNLINQGAGALLMGPKNLFVELTATLDKYIQTDGSLANVNGSRVSVFIPVASKEQYLLTIVCMTQTKAAYAFYDSAQGYVANSYTDLTNPTDFTFPQITIPDGVSFIRVSVSNSDAKVMLESGTYLTEWVPSYADRKASVSAAQAYASVMADLAANVQNSLANANSVQNSMLSILSSFGTSVDQADKGDLKSLVDGINSRLTDDVGLAATFGVDTTVYQGYAKQLTDALSKYLTDMTSTEDFDYDALGTILKQYAAYRLTTLTATNEVAQQANTQAKTDADQITQSVANAISDSAASTKHDYKGLVDDVNKAFDTYKETTEKTISQLKETDTSIKASVSDTKQAVADDVAALQAKLSTVKQVAAKTQQIANDTVTKQTAALAAIATAKPKLTSSFVSGALTDAGWNTLKYLWEDAGSAYVADIDWADSVSVNHDAYTTAYKALQSFMQLHATTKPTESEASIEKLFNDVYGAETDLFATMVTKTADDATKMNKLAADTESALGDYANLDVTDYAALEITAAKIANTVKEVQNGVTTKFSDMQQTVDGFKTIVSDTEKTVTKYTDDAIDNLVPCTHIAYANSVDGKTDFSVSDSNRTYIGMYVDFTATGSTDPTKYAWSLIKGHDGDVGPKGDQGLPGENGSDGKPSYTHIAYATSSSGAGFTQTPSTSTTYIGMYVDQIATDSNDPTDYAWSLIKGADGANGAPGKAGADGKTPYFHQAWADSSDGKTNFSTTISIGKKYLGTYTDYVAADSTDPTIYKWTELVGAIEIGGTNLYRKNGFAPTALVSGSFDSASNTWTFKKTGEGGSWVGVAYKAAELTMLEAGKTYTISWEVYSDVAGIQTNIDINNYIVGVSGTGNDNDIGSARIPRTLTVPVGQWTKSSYTITVPTGKTLVDYSSIGVTGSTVPVGTVFKIRNIKLEEGTLPTAWSPNPEDVESGITAAQSTANTAKTDAQTADGKAIDAQNKADSVGKSLSDYKTVVSKTYSTIDQTASSIKLSVSETKNELTESVNNQIANVNDKIDKSVKTVQKNVDNLAIGGRNLFLNSKSLKFDYARNSNAVNITVEPFDSTTNMWHFVAEQGVGGTVGIYLYDYAKGKLPDNSDWSYSADVKGTGKVVRFGTENGSMNPIVGTVGTEWSRISQTGHVDNPEHKTIVMYFDTTSSPLDVYIKLPKLEIGNKATDWSPAPEDVESGIATAQSTANTAKTDAQTADGKAIDAQNKADSVGQSLSDYKTVVSKTYSTIDQTASSIKLSVSETKNELSKNIADQVSEVKKSVDGIQVGGTNLVRFSEGTPEDVSHWQGASQVTSEKIDGEYAFKLVAKPTTNPSNRSFGKLEMASMPTIKPSTRYFCQIQYKVTDTVTNPPVPNTNFAIRVLHSDDGWYTEVGVTIPEKTVVGSWQTISGFVTTPANTSTVAQVTMNQGFQGIIYFKKMIIAESNVAVNWNRAPEDIFTGITTAQNTANTAQSAASTADGKAVAAQNTANNVGSDLADYKNVVSKTYSTIEQTAGQIKLSVSETKNELTESVNNQIANVNDKIDGIQVGGTNLIVRTNEIKNQILDMTGSVASNATGNIMRNHITVVPGEVLTFHQEQTPADAEYTFRWNWYDKNGNYISRTAGTNTGGTLFRWTVPANAVSILVSYPNKGRVKLERGNMATDWTPAPEDVESGIATAQSTANTAKTDAQTADGKAIDAQNKADAAQNKAVDAQNKANSVGSDLADYKNVVSKTYSTIDQTASSIKLSVGRVEDKVNNIQVGGTNLLVNTEFGEMPNGWNSYYGSNVEGIGGHPALHASTIGDTDDHREILQQAIYNGAGEKRVLPSQWYTLSFYAKGSGEVKSYVYPDLIDTTFEATRDGVKWSIGSDGYSIWNLNSTWTKHVITFKTKSVLPTTNADQNVLWRLFKGNEVYICMPQLEEGMVASSWSPSEGDVVHPNLFRNSRLDDNGRFWHISGGAQISTSNTDKMNGVAGIGSNSGVYIKQEDLVEPLISGKTYTVSLTAGGSGRVNFGLEGGKTQIIPISSTTETVRLSHTFVYNGENGAFVFYSADDASIIGMNSFKLEEGNWATKWQPSSVDIQTSVAIANSVGRALDDYKTVKDTRNDNQPPSWYWTTYPKQVVKEFKNRSVIGIDGAKDASTYVMLETIVAWDDTSGGNIKQTAKSDKWTWERWSVSETVWGAWVLVADTSNVISTINMSPESVTISASKINLEGQVSISDLDSTVLKSGTTKIDGGNIYADSLSAISANLGDVTAGTITGSVFKSTSEQSYTIPDMATLNTNGNFTLDGQGVTFLYNVTGWDYPESGRMWIGNGAVRAISVKNQTTPVTDFGGASFPVGGLEFDLSPYELSFMNDLNHHVRIDHSGFHLQDIDAMTSLMRNELGFDDIYLRKGGDGFSIEPNNFTSPSAIELHGDFSYIDFHTKDSTTGGGNDDYAARIIAQLRKREDKVRTADLLLSADSVQFWTGSQNTEIWMGNNQIEVDSQDNLQLGARKEIWAKNAGGYWLRFTGKDLYSTSMREEKTNIKEYNDALNMVNSTSIYEYSFKSDLANGEHSYQVGMILDEAPAEVAGPNGVSTYAIAAINWKATQEMSNLVNEQRNEIDVLTERLALLEAKTQ